MPSDEADRSEHEFNLCELEIVLKSGERKTVRVEYHRGHVDLACSWRMKATVLSYCSLLTRTR